MTNDATSWKVSRVLVPLDGSETAKAALPEAFELARRSGAQLTLLSVLDPARRAVNTGAESIGIDDQERIWADRQLQPIRQHVGAAGTTIVTAVEVGDPATTIVSYATEHAIDVIVMATHGRSGFKRWIVGSVTGQVVRSARCPVLTVRPDGHNAFHPIQRIVAALDFSADSLNALGHARTLAKLFAAEIVVAHVVEPLNFIGPPEMNIPSIQLSDLVEEQHRAGRDHLAKLVSELEAAGQPATASLLDGYAAQQIVASGRKADMIVMGTHGRSGVWRMLLGSVAERVVRLAPCPVLTVRDPAVPIPSE